LHSHRKWILPLIIILVFFFCSVVVNTRAVPATQNAFVVTLDGKKINFPDEVPFIDSNNRTLVPVRFVSEALGYKVDRDAKNMKVTIQGSKTIVLTINSKNALVNGQTVKMDTQAILKNGRTFVPLRFISEGMGCTVNYTYKNFAHYITILTGGPVVEEQYDKYGLPITPLNYCTTQDEYIKNTPPGMTPWAKTTPLNAKASNTGDYAKDIQADAALFESKSWYGDAGNIVFNAAYSPVGKLNDRGGWSEAFYIHRDSSKDYYINLSIKIFDSKNINGGKKPDGKIIPNSIPMAIREALIFYLGEDDGEEAFRIIARGYTKGTETSQIENKPFEFGSNNRQMVINTEVYGPVQIYISHPGDKFINIWGDTK